jgi:hypothetical protein
MSENKNPLVSLGELSRPATVLIEKISDAVGGICKPWQMVRVAKAEAEVERMREVSQIQVTDLHKRAFRRFVTEEAVRQANIEGITAKALPLLKEESQPQNVENDWVTNFFDKSRIVSDEGMQRLWSRILAGEANTPGSFSRQTVNLMGDLEKEDAELLTRLCGFGWRIMSRREGPLVYKVDHDIYDRNGLYFESLEHLDAIGLIHHDNLVGFAALKLPEKFSATYFGASVDITLPKNAGGKLSVGNVLLTQAGRELARICEPKPVEGYLDYVYEIWQAKSLVPKKETKQGVPAEGHPDTAAGDS